MHCRFARNLNIYLAVYFSAESHSRIRSTVKRERSGRCA